MESKLAVQLFTVRDLFAQDSKKTLQAVKDIGYSAVEFGGLGHWKAEDIRAQLDEIGLKAVGAHMLVERLENELSTVITEAKTLGLEYVTCPWLPPERRNAEDYRNLVPILKNAAEACNSNGFTFCYHHHDFELAPVFGSTTALEFLAQELDSSLLKLEIDVYWAAVAGLNPVAFLEQYAGRVPLVHLKDMTKDSARTFAEVGTGSLDIAGILETAKRIGVAWGIVEQDVCQRPPLESLEISFNTLKKLGMG